MSAPCYAKKYIPGLWVIIERIGPFTDVFRDTGHLDVIVCHAIPNNDRGEVDLPQVWKRCQLEFLVLVVDDVGDIWYIP